MVGIIEGTDCMEHWVWCKNNEHCYAEKKQKVKKIRNNMEDLGRWIGEGSCGKSEGETNHERLWTLRNKLRVLEGKA